MKYQCIFVSKRELWRQEAHAQQNILPSWGSYVTNSGRETSYFANYRAFDAYVQSSLNLCGVGTWKEPLL